MPELEQRLAELAPDAVWPPTPDLAATVVARLDAMSASAPAAPPRRRRRGRALLRRRSRRLLAAVVAVLVALPAAAFALPGPRHAILDALGLRHVAVERRVVPPSAVADPQLGTPTTLAEAARRAGFVPAVPSLLGAPDAVYEHEGIVTVVYKAPTRPALLLAQAEGRLNPFVLRKFAGVDDVVETTTVRGAAALFLPADHRYGWTDATGPPVRSGPALIWEIDGRVLRLEGERSLSAARRIADSVA